MGRYFTPLLLCCVLHANPPQWAQFLPPTANIAAIQADAQGNIYLAGRVTPAKPKGANDSTDAFLAKYSPAGDPVFFHTFGGSNTDGVNALAIGKDGAIYAAGNTWSSDFPTTTAAQAPPAPGFGGPFLAKFDPSGAMVFSVVYGLSTGFAALAIDDQGQAVVTGLQGGATPGFVAKLSQDGTRVLFTFANYGGAAIALDLQQNIYVIGLNGPTDPKMTPGAFQNTHATLACSSFGVVFGIACEYQHVAKISADGSKLIYATFLNGTYGATPSSIAVDAAGNAIIAGSTYSSDFPVTPGVLQNVPTAQGTQSLHPNMPFPGSPPPPDSGFLTKLNATGTDLVWSTFFSGTREDSLSAMTIAADSSIYIAGLAGSDDLPGLQSTPAGCRPKFLQFAPYVAHLSADASAIYSTSLFADSMSVLLENPLVAIAPSGLVAAATPGPLLIGSQSVSVPGAELASLDLEASNPFACIVDAADTAPIASVAPGQLVTLYGEGFSNTMGSTSPSPSFPTSFGGVTVTFNGIPAPLLYVSDRQVNVQVPFEVAGADTVTMSLSAQPSGEAPVNEAQLLRVVPSAPALFRSAETTPVCGPFNSQIAGVIVPLTRNADGSFNSSCNPAAFGSTVTVYANGVGNLGIPETTGQIAPQPAVPLKLFFFNNETYDVPAGVVANTTLPGSISGLVELQIKLPLYTSDGFFQLNLQYGSIPFRDTAAVIWAK